MGSPLRSFASESVQLMALRGGSALAYPFVGDYWKLRGPVKLNYFRQNLSLGHCRNATVEAQPPLTIIYH